MSDDPVVTMTKKDFDDALDKAAEVGALRALKTVGLDDKDAPDDVRELRSVIKSWREVRKSALQAIVKFLTTALLGAALLGAGIKLGGSSLLKESPPAVLPASPAPKAG